MKTLTKDEVVINHMNIKDEILDGEVIIYPTDTIYGLGCNALDEKAVHFLNSGNQAVVFFIFKLKIDFKQQSVFFFNRFFQIQVFRDHFLGIVPPKNGC